MENKKNNVWIIVLLVIVIVGLAGYICYDKFLVNKNADNCGANNNSINNVEVPNTVSCSDCEDSFSDFSKSFEKHIVFNGGVKTLKYELDNDNRSVLIDGKEIYNKVAAYDIGHLYVIDSETIWMEDSGTGIGNNEVLIFDSNLNKVSADSFYIEDGDMMLVFFNDNFSFNNGKFLIDATRQRGVYSNAIFDGNDVSLCDEYNNFVGQKYNGQVLEAQYEIDYLGNSKFSTPKLVKTLKTVDSSICK